MECVKLKSFIENITEKDNEYIKRLKECKNNGYKTYIWGNGEGADNAEIRSDGFEFNGRLVNRRFLADDTSDTKCFEDILENCNTRINLVIAFKGFKEEFITPWKSKIAVLVDMDCFSGNMNVGTSEITYDYIMDNEKKFQDVYEALADDKSRDSLVAYINQKISLKYGFLEKVYIENQYFNPEVMPLKEGEVFVDCGAYNGDSAEAFIREQNKRGIGEYKKIISFEPDPNSFQELQGKHILNHICINKGTSDKREELKFSTIGTSSGINQKGEYTIETTTIDEVVLGEATLIKMDVEGAELSSLKGAEKCIKDNKPKLAICIYHKREDPWQIYEYIKSLVPGYRFYIRAHEKEAIELVLYAIYEGEN